VPWPPRPTARACSSPPATRWWRSTWPTRATSGSATLPSAALALAASNDGARIFALRGRALEILDGTTLQPLAAINLKARGITLAVSPSGTRAIVALQSDAVAVVDLTTRRIAKRLKIQSPSGVAIDAAGRAWVSATVSPKRRKGSKRRPMPAGRLVAVSPSTGATGPSVNLGALSGGGGVAIDPDGRRAMVAAGGPLRGRERSAALVDLGRRRVAARPRTGRGPAAPTGPRTARGSTSPTAATARSPCSAPSPTSA
jgi:DNA-binding beta-propeller fold protein YncE